MLNVHFGDIKGELWGPSKVFDYEYEDSWFDDPFVRKMVLAVDKSEVKGPYSIISPVLGNISCEKLSGGVKNLILAYKTDYIIDMSFSGDNCAEWFLEIGKRKNLTGALHHIMKFPEPFEIKVLNSGVVVHTMAELCMEMLAAHGRGEY